MKPRKIILTFTPHEDEGSSDVDISIKDEGFNGDVDEIARHILLTAATIGDMLAEQERQ